MRFELNISDIKEHADDLVEFHKEYVEYFQNATRNVAPHALEYMRGQLLCESRRNMKRMSVQVSQKNNQALSHFVSKSPWKEEELIEAIGGKAVELMESHQERGDRALILDESGIAKQGDESVGVARQYCGALGKVDNCQVGVFLSYSTDIEATLIDRRLYLPSHWVKDSQRCEKAGIPKEEQVFHSKGKLGLEMILEAKERAIPFEFVGMDAHYGEQPWLLTQLEKEDLVYVADIPCNTRVYGEFPLIGIPKRQGKRGRHPTIPRVLQGEALGVKKLLASIKWQSLKIRDTQRGELWIRFAALRVFRIEDELPSPQPVWLLIRQQLDGSDTKFSFSNAPASASVQTLANWQSRRFWIERSIEDAKGLAGLDEYQLIGWRGWHHHMTMVLLSMLYLLQLKCSLRPKAPMLTLQDALDILKVVMPKKQLSHDDVINLIREKHINRFRSRNSSFRRQIEQLFASGFLM